MTLTHYFAKLLGLYLIIGGVAFIVRKQAMMEILALFADNRPLIYIGAMVRILLGLAIILANNPWSGGALPIVISVIGWATLLPGIVLLMLPHEATRKLVAYFQRTPVFYADCAVLIMLGLYLTYSGFTA